MKRTTIRLMAAASCCAATLALAQTSDPAWLDELNYQIRIDKQCEVTYLVRMSESRLGDSIAYEARVQCLDGRMFDASRIGESLPFTFKACEQQVC